MTDHRRSLYLSPGFLLLLLIPLLVGGCGMPRALKPEPEPTVVELTVEAASNINPDRGGRPSPVLVRIYELKDLGSFKGADFFSLFEDEQGTLGGDMVARDEIMLAPGERYQATRPIADDTRHLALMAAFRDIDRARWRSSVAVPANRTTPVTVRIDTLSLSAQADD